MRWSITNSGDSPYPCYNKTCTRHVGKQGAGTRCDEHASLARVVDRVVDEDSEESFDGKEQNVAYSIARGL